MLSTSFSLKLGLAVLGLAGLAFSYTVHRSSLIAEGKEAALLECAAANNREAAREISRLVAENEKIAKDYARTSANLASARSNLSKSSARLREQSDELAKALGGASAQSLREYAATCERNLAGLREDTARFGLEAAEGSAASHALSESLRACSGSLTP